MGQNGRNVQTCPQGRVPLFAFSVPIGIFQNFHPFHPQYCCRSEPLFGFNPRSFYDQAFLFIPVSSDWIDVISGSDANTLTLKTCRNLNQVFGILGEIRAIGIFGGRIPLFRIGRMLAHGASVFKVGYPLIKAPNGFTWATTAQKDSGFHHNS